MQLSPARAKTSIGGQEMNQGWIKLHRKILDSSIWIDPLQLRAFLWLLLSANHKPRKIYIRNIRAEITVGEGEVITSYSAWAEGIKYKEPKRGSPWKTPSTQEMRTIRNHLEITQMVTGVPTGGCLHLVIENWGLYQLEDKKVTGVATGVSTEVQQRSNTEQELSIKEKDIYSLEIEEIIDYLNSLAGSSYRPTTRETARLISGRLSEGYNVEDCKAVIRHRWEKWQGDPQMREYIRPSTLFRPAKFESYLQEARRCEKEGGGDGQHPPVVTVGHILEEVTWACLRAGNGEMDFEQFGAAILKRYESQTINPVTIQEAWDRATVGIGEDNGR